MKKKTFFKGLAYTAGLITIGTVGYFKRDSIACIAKSISSSLKGQSFTPNVILSEEVPVIPEIVNNLSKAATQISEGVKSSTGEKILANVFSNMVSHPESGRLEIPMDNLSAKGVEALKSIASKVMGESGEVINNTLCFG